MSTRNSGYARTAGSFPRHRRRRRCQQSLLRHLPSTRRATLDRQTTSRVVGIRGAAGAGTALAASAGLSSNTLNACRTAIKTSTAPALTGGVAHSLPAAYIPTLLLRSAPTPTPAHADLALAPRCTLHSDDWLCPRSWLDSKPTEPHSPPSLPLPPSTPPLPPASPMPPCPPPSPEQPPAPPPLHPQYQCYSTPSEPFGSCLESNCCEQWQVYGCFKRADKKLWAEYA